MKTMAEVAAWIRENPGKSALDVMQGSGYHASNSAQVMGMALRSRQIIHQDVQLGANNRWYPRDVGPVAPSRTFEFKPLQPMRHTIVRRPEGEVYRTWPSAYDGVK